MQEYTDDAKMVGFVLEGELDVMTCDEVTMNALYDLYARGKELWDNGSCSKYVIAIITDNGIVCYIRPDQSNFETCENYEHIVQNWLESNELTQFEEIYGDHRWNTRIEQIFANDYGYDIVNA